MADEIPAKRNIVHVHAGADLVIHCEEGMVLLSCSRLVEYTNALGGSPTVKFEGVSLRIIET